VYLLIVYNFNVLAMQEQSPSNLRTLLTGAVLDQTRLNTW